ncbi:SH3 domain-containing protein [Nannizzia gypsea CBS 118893]|uniref:SH3 domain-containing protein n=1 Tax=Arthroderma gypseum (strain ATCC MYA-4604 / CBS 118893) TaxID=535722 RepID=E5R1P8_ARTGP|nr:SH3 domain-containing protein [Nannizzia gypsea CBS 118893]EFQ97746.1 SH3 domain-containing protein [Nannizzia gypsea CBS 118893]
MSAVPFTVKAVFEYTSEHEDDLNFSIGQIITVTEEEDADWYYGNYTNDAGARQEGIFPRNFVEKYEPPAPPRPTRPARARKESETTSQSPPLASEPAMADIPQEDSHKRSIDLGSTGEAEKQNVPAPAPYESPKRPAPAATPSSPPMSPPSQKPAPPPPSAPVETSAKKAPPPAVAEKPIAGSFKDRIAAFNKASAAPIIPFNHTTNTSSSFVKKPFVAPPPSKNAYIPPPIEHPQIYRREEPQENSLPTRSEAPETTEAAQEELPKPTSLKERIALLQKQQLEQASRHAEAAQKKEKPKKPSKKKVESQEPVEPSEPTIGVELQRTETSETAKELSAASGGPAEESMQPKHRTPVLPPARELTSDTNDADNSAAGDTEEASETSTSKEDVEEKSFEPRSQKNLQSDTPDANASDEEESEEQEEDEIDPEIRRRMEIRDRMAKISGGMGMMGMFGAPAGLPGMPTGGYKKPKAPPAESGTTDQQPEAYAPPVQLMALPGMHVRKPEETPKSPPAVPEEPSEVPIAPSQPLPSASDEAPETTSEEPVTPHGRPVPPPPPVAHNLPPPPPPPETRPVPPPPQSIMTSVSPGAKSNDEAVLSPARTERGDDESYFPGHETPGSSRRSIDQGKVASPVSSPVSRPEKRQSHPPPPLPSAPPVPSSVQTRPPPPPPPTDPISHKPTSDRRMSSQTPTRPPGSESEEEITEYEGDYDTDIASGAKHKDALKAHARDSSVDEGTLADSFSPHSPRSPIETRPPIPQTTFANTAPRSAPPPPPSQPPKASRQSVDMPRVPPPPVPQTTYTEEDDTHERALGEAFDQHTAPAVPVHRDRGESQTKEIQDEMPYEIPQHTVSSPQAPRPSRGSVDLLRGQTGTRRSMDISRPSMDQGYMANDVDLASTSLWWTQPNTPPPVFQGRRDIIFEIEESSTSKRGGKITTSKDVYILFMDYSQTIVSAQFDSKNPIDVALEQRHEPPPPRLRQDQLEDAHTQFGARISESVASKQNTTVGDGTPHALIQTLLAPLKDALLPVGVRSYGALVYANLANASVQQFDEIRPGDIITFRNCRFQGHRGTMHQKYSAEVGKPDHSGVVSDWDGTKKKVRAWEQGRESKKTKVESYKLGDLKSGECRVWRVMPRSWVGWDGEHKP